MEPTVNTNTKIIVLHQKNLIYTAIFIIIILLLIMLIIRNAPHNSRSDYDIEPEYTAGVYSSTIILNGNPIDIQITMDTNKIHDINLKNTAESITTMYPIFNSCFDEIKNQVLQNNSIENIQYGDNNRYTSLVIEKAITKAVQKSIQPN